MAWISRRRSNVGTVPYYSRGRTRNDSEISRLISRQDTRISCSERLPIGKEYSLRRQNQIMIFLNSERGLLPVFSGKHSNKGPTSLLDLPFLVSQFGNTFLFSFFLSFASVLFFLYKRKKTRLPFLQDESQEFVYFFILAVNTSISDHTETFSV